MLKRITLLFALILVQLSVTAQEQEIQMADTMRSNGKIYVVVAVILTIFAMLILYLVRLDRKISKLEKTIHN